MTRTLAVIPARGGSKRVPKKNSRLFGGKPLVAWSLEFATGYAGFERVVVSTDCPEVAAIARQHGIEVPWMRPAALATDVAGTVDVVLHALEMAAAQGEHYDRVALLQPTTPLRRVKHWDEAARALDGGAPAAVGVSMIAHHPYWVYWLGDGHRLQPCFPGKERMRSQDLPPAAAVNGALYLIETEALRVARSFCPEGGYGVLMTDPVDEIDIDTEEDWSAAERIAGVGRGC